MHRPAMLRGGREVQPVAGTEAERVLIDKPRFRPEMCALRRQNREALGDKPVEYRESGSPQFQRDLPDP